MARLTIHHKRSIRKNDKTYQCLLEDLVEMDILPAEVVDTLLAQCSGHEKKSAPVMPVVDNAPPPPPPPEREPEPEENWSDLLTRDE
jgi:hypothetical protein